MSINTISPGTKLSESRFQFMILNCTHFTKLTVCQLTFLQKEKIFAKSSIDTFFIYCAGVFSYILFPDQSCWIFFSVEPMDIEGEAACAVGPQLVTEEGEKGGGIVFKRTSSHLEANNLLAMDEGKPTDDQEQVTASDHDKFAKTASVFRNKLDQLSKLQVKDEMGKPSAKGRVQDVRDRE